MNENGIVKPLKQRHLEAFMRGLREHGVDPTAPFEGKALPEQIEAVGAIVRAAASAEMLNGTNPDDLEPWQATRLAAAALGAAWESLSVPKASSSQQPNMPMDAEPARTS